MLNRTRVWLNCFNLDRSTASWQGKSSTIVNTDFVATHSQDWYKQSQYNLENFDIHLSCYNAELRVLGEFKKEIYSDPSHPTGLNLVSTYLWVNAHLSPNVSLQSLDIPKLASDADEKIRKLKSEWDERLKEGVDSNGT